MLRAATVSTLPLPESSTATTDPVQIILHAIARGALSPAQLQTLLAAVAGALIAASSAPPLQSQFSHNSGEEKNFSKKLALTRVEAADAIGVSPRTLDDLVKRRVIRP